MNEQSIVWIYIPTYAVAKEQTQIWICVFQGSANKNLFRHDLAVLLCSRFDALRTKIFDCIAMIDARQVMKHLIQAGNELFILCATLFNPLVNYIIYWKGSIIMKKIK